MIGGGIDDHGVTTFNGGLRFRCLSGHLVERQLELIIGGGAAGVVGAPVAVLGVPLHVVASDGVFDIIQAVAQVDKLPIVIDSAKIHAGVSVRQADALAVLLEAVGAVVVGYHSPHIVIGIAGDSTVCANRDVSTHIVEASLFAGQRLVIGGGVDHYLVAVGNGGLSGWFILLNSIVESLHRALVLAQHSDGFQSNFCTNFAFNLGLACVAVLHASCSRLAAVQGIVNLRARCRGT